MSKKTSIKERVRRSDVRVEREKNNAIISCPFCETPHPLGTEPSFCGTKLEIKAVQTVYTGATCSLCGKTGGQQIRFGNIYAHTPSCSPGKILFQKPPKLSGSARVAFKMPDGITKLLYKFGWSSVEVANPQTKEVAGYSWVKMPKGVKK